MYVVFGKVVNPACLIVLDRHVEELHFVAYRPFSKLELGVLAAVVELEGDSVIELEVMPVKLSPVGGNGGVVR